MQGFVINPYDWCIANKTVNGKQCTIIWHVDDLKISHANPMIADGIIASLKTEYGKVGEMTVRHGQKYDYLGMTLDFSRKGNFIIDMESYLHNILEDLPDEFGRLAATPAANLLFKTRDSVNKLDPERTKRFHRVTAQLLFVSHRGRPDM